MRPAVKAFAESMEKTLKNHDHRKHGWNDMHVLSLFNLMQAECDELEEELLQETQDPDRIVSECTDIANYCMMISDKVKYQFSNRGRE